MERFLISVQDPSEEKEPEFLMALFAQLHLAAQVGGRGEWALYWWECKRTGDLKMLNC